jgi:hypothetical protein
VQLPDPRHPRILHRRIQEDNLILDPDLVHDRLQDHMRVLVGQLLFLGLLVRVHLRAAAEHPPFARLSADSRVGVDVAVHHPPSTRTRATHGERRECRRERSVFSRTGRVEFGAPDVDDAPEPLEEDALDALVELEDPVLEVSVAFQVKTIDLRAYIYEIQDGRMKKITYSTLNLTQQRTERLSRVRTRTHILDRPHDILEQVHDVVRFILQNELYQYP